MYPILKDDVWGDGSTLPVKTHIEKVSGGCKISGIIPEQST